MQVVKPILLDKLQAELAAAGITVAGLSMSGTTLLQVRADGSQAEMPAGSQAVVNVHDATDSVRGAVVAQIQALAGLKWTDLTAAQKQGLIVALLYKVGALDKTLTVRPLADWL